VVCGQHAAMQDPGNGYAMAALDREWAMFEAGASVPAEVMAAHFRHVIGEPAPHSDPSASSHPLLPDLHSEVTVLDLSATSDALHGGRWLDPGAESAVVAEALASGGSAVLTRHGECRLTRTRIDTTEQSATLALGVEVHLADPLAVHSPWAGTVTRHAEHGVTLTAGGLHLVLDGIDPAVAVIDAGEAVSGQRLGTVAASGGCYRLDVQLSRLGTGIAPRFAPPGLDAGWLTMCPDPTGLILPRADRPAADTPTVPASVLLERRAKSFATVQEHYFETPPQIERGWQHYLVDTRGRGYLDMLNNVTILATVTRDWLRQCTSSGSGSTPTPVSTTPRWWSCPSD